MCQLPGHLDQHNAAIPQTGGPFPWELGVYDAHCHPTDTLSSLESIPHMKASALTVMATRSQDQALVADAAASPLAIRSKSDVAPRSADQTKGRIIPCFGWHPWFSHQLYDDTVPEDKRTYQPPKDDDQDKHAAKHAHYAAVLQPSPKPGNTAFLDSLPEPRPLSGYLEETRGRLEEHALALVGEVGLDKAFRLPEPFDERTSAARDDTLTPGGREGRLLSPQHVRMPHQIAILKAQLALAGELGRAVSVHGVQAHGVLHDTLASIWKGHEKEVLSRRERRRVAPGAEDFSSSGEEEDDDDEGDGYDAPIAGKEAKSKPADGRRRVDPKPYPPRICLHSFSGPDQMLKQYLNPAIPAKMFFSFSVAINLGTDNGHEKLADVLKLCPDDRILIESDLHTAGDRMDDALEAMYRRVCEMKGWGLEEGVKRIARNYEEFIFG